MQTPKNKKFFFFFELFPYVENKSEIVTRNIDFVKDFRDFIFFLGKKFYIY